MSATDRRAAARSGRRAELGTKLLPAVERLLADGASFTELSVDELLAEAGVARSTFYKAFEGKGDLLVEWLGQIVDELEQAADAWFTLGGDARREELAAALAETMRAYAPHAVVMSAAYEVAPFDAAVGAALHDLSTRGVAGLRQHLKRGQREGWVDAALPADETATFLTAMGERAYQQLRRLGAEHDLDRLRAAHTDLVWHALYAHAPAHAPG
ncbi:TetR/AcrR family transcriptional regulator [Conexibacter sp. SYSU D00693]|uniref:TetR/AcrR family transcriptional regulator n=1 Tax=Conexibacter sp. SYSU D00693 TaxID=2812560 RepID=UPI00196B7655|nr:TetR/AcrR family transcriptional regulator [Conexibacter sp. SYSU D00693]